MISWAEILNRAEKQEQFIREYDQSAKVDDIRELLKQYAAFSLYGANNTPLFSYETKQIVPEAKKAYLAVSFDATKGTFSKAMAGYIEILNKHDYKLTAEVQNYRNKATAEIH